MKDPNLSELVRTCIRCWLYLVPQAFLGIHLFDMFMRRKNSIKPLMIWQLLRVFLIGGISDIILRGYYGDESWWGILMMFCSVVIMIANTVLIYYTFEGSLPKVVLGAMLADIAPLYKGRHGDLVEGHLLQHLPKGPHDGLLCV